MCQPCVKIPLSLTESARSRKSRSDEATLGLRASSPAQYRIRDVMEPVFQLTWAWAGAGLGAQHVYLIHNTPADLQPAPSHKVRAC